MSRVLSFNCEALCHSAVWGLKVKSHAARLSTYEATRFHWSFLSVHTGTRDPRVEPTPLDHSLGDTNGIEDVVYLFLESQTIKSTG
jgi:hypothetical protein